MHRNVARSLPLNCLASVAVACVFAGAGCASKGTTDVRVDGSTDFHAIADFATNPADARAVGCSSCTAAETCVVTTQLGAPCEGYVSDGGCPANTSPVGDCCQISTTQTSCWPGRPECSGSFCNEACDTPAAIGGGISNAGGMCTSTTAGTVSCGCNSA